MPYKLMAYLLPVIMLVLATIASILPWYIPYRKKLHQDKQNHKQNDDLLIRKLSRELVDSVPTNDPPVRTEALPWNVFPPDFNKQENMQVLTDN